MNLLAVLVGTGSTLLGIVVGAALERIRDNTKWRRDEEARWTNELRVLYRDLLTAGDQFWRHVYQAQQLEVRARAADGTSVNRVADRIVGQLEDVYAGMDREIGKAVAIVSEIALIGSERETDITRRFVAELTAGALLYDKESAIEKVRAGYQETRKELVEAARSVLRRGDVK
jgi:hypothetical protein